MKKLQHKFVDTMPAKLEDGILYVSIRFRIVSHNCCCGCGNEVVVNLSPAGWQLTFDGESISLSPSIGNWTLPCRSHYWIRNNTVQWAESWSKKKSLAAQKLDALTNERYYRNRNAQDQWQPGTGVDGIEKGKAKKGFWQRLFRWR
jgi:Family of unknown function (DUF6527)